jgi:hypothetical protein
MERADYKRAEFAVSDQSQLGALRQLLGLAVPGTRVRMISGQPEPGEQGATDILALLASSSGVVAAIKILPEFLRSRKTALSVTVTVDGKSVTLTATNVDDVLPILERLLDD